jgi:NAD(P)-dependent dehydrogenase (short-subunit alcohol dehydrogenase family)
VKITDTSALVTGGASGLGLATARALRTEGVRVVIVDLPTSGGETVAGELGGGAVFVPADVTNPDEVSVAVAKAQELGPFRIAVNCAGIVAPGKIIGRAGPLPLEDYTRVIMINLVGTFNVLRLSAEAMQSTEPDEGERGVIVNTASVAAFDGQIGQPAYASSKAGVVGLTLPAAREFAASLIRVVTIAPGIFETPMMAGLPDDARASLGAQVPHPSRLGRPQEYAALVRHILENPMLNGETIRLDGAIRMSPR